MVVKNGLKISLMLILTMLLCGCWDSLPVENRNLVTAVGVDYLPEPPHYLITFVAPIVDEQRSQATRMRSFRATNLAEAHAMASHADAQVYSYGKLLVVVLGEEAARQGVSVLMNDLFKHPDLRVESYVAVTLGTAQKLLTTIPPEGQRVSLFLKEMLDRDKMQQDTPPTSLDIFTTRMMTPGLDATTSLLTPIGSTDPRPPEERGSGGSGTGGGGGKQTGEAQGTTAEDIQIIGMAAWQGDRLVGTTNLPQQQYFALAHGTSQTFFFQLLLKADPRFVPETSRLVINVESVASSWEVQIIEGVPHFSVKINTQVHLVNYQGTVDLTEPENSDEMTKMLTENLTQGIMDALHTVSYTGSDPIGLGQLVRVQQPHVWDSKMWTEMLKTATFSVDVKLIIKNIGVHITRFEPKDKTP